MKAGFPIDAEVEVFTHKNRKITYKIQIYASMSRTVLCTYFLVLSDQSVVSTSSRRKGKRSSTGIKVFCVVPLYEHAHCDHAFFAFSGTMRKCCSSLGYQKDPKRELKLA